MTEEETTQCGCRIATEADGTRVLKLCEAHVAVSRSFERFRNSLIRATTTYAQILEAPQMRSNADESGDMIMLAALIVCSEAHSTDSSAAEMLRGVHLTVDALENVWSEAVKQSTARRTGG